MDYIIPSHKQLYQIGFCIHLYIQNIIHKHTGKIIYSFESARDLRLGINARLHTKEQINEQGV